MFFKRAATPARDRSIANNAGLREAISVMLGLPAGLGSKSKVMPQSSNGTRATARIRFQKATVEKLKRELSRLDSRTRSHYVTRFLHEFRRAESVCQFSDLLNEAARADVIYLADYHALPASQAFAVRFVNQLLERRGKAREVVLCLEAFLCPPSTAARTLSQRAVK